MNSNFISSHPQLVSGFFSLYLCNPPIPSHPLLSALMHTPSHDATNTNRAVILETELEG